MYDWVIDRLRTVSLFHTYDGLIELKSTLFPSSAERFHYHLPSTIALTAPPMDISKYWSGCKCPTLLGWGTSSIL